MATQRTEKIYQVRTEQSNSSEHSLYHYENIYRKKLTLQNACFWICSTNDLSSELLDSVAVAMVACVATFFFPFLPSPVANFLRILALAWPVLGPYAQATVRNARFRLQAGGRGGARVVCGHAWVDAHSIVHVDDGEVCVEIRAPSKTLSLPAQPACALVVGISVVDVLFPRSGRSLMRSPFVNLKSFRNACVQAWDEKDGDEHITWNVSD